MSTCGHNPNGIPGCTCGDRCEMPCWQRIGLTASSCCDSERAAAFLATVLRQIEEPDADASERKRTP
jgi:hypothetical protein